MVLYLVSGAQGMPVTGSVGKGILLKLGVHGVVDPMVGLRSRGSFESLGDHPITVL